MFFLPCGTGRCSLSFCHGGKTENEIQDGGCVVNDRTVDVIGRKLSSDVVSNLQQETILTLLISILVPGKIIGKKG